MKEYIRMRIEEALNRNTPAPYRRYGKPRASKQRTINGTAYFHGTPCKRAGHTLRYGSIGICVECHRERLRNRTNSNR